MHYIRVLASLNNLNMAFLMRMVLVNSTEEGGCLLFLPKLPGSEEDDEVDWLVG